MSNMVEEEFVSEVKNQWRRLWRERIDDRVRAEGIASMDFDKLFVERGTVVLATRDFRFVTLREILEQHKVESAEQYVPPSKYVGGWRKFGHTCASRFESAGRSGREGFAWVEVKKPQQLRKGGRGWLHV